MLNEVVNGVEKAGEAIAEVGPRMIKVGKCAAIATATFIVGVGTGVLVKVGIDTSKSKKKKSSNARIEALNDAIESSEEAKDIIEKTKKK